jgi:hypothetical protein
MFPRSARALGIVVLRDDLALDCEVQLIDLGRRPSYFSATWSQSQ